MKIKLVVKTEKLYKKIEESFDSFVQMESNSLHSVDVEACVSDYVTSLCIFDQTLFELK